MSHLDRPNAVLKAIDLMNPNPTSRKTLSGMIYRVSFEMKQEDWQHFADANTSGMVLEASFKVRESHGKQRQEDDADKERRVLAAAGVALLDDPRFADYLRDVGSPILSRRKYVDGILGEGWFASIINNQQVAEKFRDAILGPYRVYLGARLANVDRQGPDHRRSPRKRKVDDVSRGGAAAAPPSEGNRGQDHVGDGG